jgi:pimeloyl-ACP methyl ester carboxylesterase
MGGRIAIEMALTESDRVDRLVLLSPAMAWLRPRRWAPVVRLLRPELSLLPMPVEPLIRRLVPKQGWAAAGMDEFLRAYSTARGRHAFNAVARNIYLDEPHGDDGLWARLGAMTHESLFVWGRRDTLVPIGFMRHVEKAFPAARHVELDCGHVPQVERPRETHAAIRDFLG